MSSKLPEVVVFGGGVLWLAAQLLIFAWLEKSRFLALGSKWRIGTKGGMQLHLFQRWPWLRA